MSDPSDSLHIVASGTVLGADIEGLDLRQPLDDASFAKVEGAWLDHQVLRFRSQTLDNAQLAAFSARFGVLDLAPITATGEPPVPSQPEIAVISNVVENGRAKGSLGNSELVWHQDMSYNELPPKASLLYGIEVPETGGETLFHSLYTAFEALPEELKARIAGLTCKHDATRNSSGQLRHGYAESYSNEERPGAIHPMVIRHPGSGRQALCIGRRPNAWITGLPDDESDALLDEIWSYVENGGVHWAQSWQKGDVMLWDNRCVLHRRERLDPAVRRHMHRTQVQAEQRPRAA
ncbi:MAG: TauD/TfdA family dioxygenase [Gammaproteobacteria bacterium]|nr:TauD/TfdA family dioxygenase [Gammaproteobacteria bacterium]